MIVVELGGSSNGLSSVGKGGSKSRVIVSDFLEKKGTSLGVRLNGEIEKSKDEQD